MAVTKGTPHDKRNVPQFTIPIFTILMSQSCYSITENTATHLQKLDSHSNSFSQEF